MHQSMFRNWENSCSHPPKFIFYWNRDFSHCATAELEYMHGYCAEFSQIFLELQETKSIRISEQIRVIDHYAVDQPSEKDLRAGLSVTNKVQHLSGFQNREELLTMHNCTCILLSSRVTPQKRVNLFSSLPVGRCTGVHERVLRGIFMNFSDSSSWATRNKTYQYFRTDKGYWRLPSRATLREGFMLFSSLARGLEVLKKILHNMSINWLCILSRVSNKGPENLKTWTRTSNFKFKSGQVWPLSVSSFQV